MTRHHTLMALGLFMVAFFTIIYFRDPAEVRECRQLIEDIDDEVIQLLIRRRGYESFGPLNDLIANRARDLDDRIAGALWAYVEALQEAEAAFMRNDDVAYRRHKKAAMERLEIARMRCRELGRPMTRPEKARNK